MKISDLIRTLQSIQETEGDVPVQMQSGPITLPDEIEDFEDFFVVEEPYEDGVRVNLRWWPY